MRGVGDHAPADGTKNATNPSIRCFFRDMMASKTSSQANGVSLPVTGPGSGEPRPRRNFAKWRAFSLSLVYLVFAAHIIHWKLTGKTLAPLELNEVMYTLELGIITAGFLFMCALVLGTLIFGRFFCSWACHIMVLQDLCAWILRKLGIRQKPIRSRLLLLVPPLTAAYMFLWPQIVRAWQSHAIPTFHMASDADGWASFVTNNFWRNLPSAPVIILTFLVCGFAIVYLLGSRTFCTYVCPYGAVFALADRFSPGRIRVSDACEQCGRCTAECTSGIRVHEEVKQHGMIVNPACLKDLDCVAVCPQNALSYGIAKPALFKSHASGGRFGRTPYDFSLLEELVMAVVFIVVLLSFRGLYSRVPFLLSLALGGIIGYFTITALRLAKRPNVTLAALPLRKLGRLTGKGVAFTGAFALLAVFVGHSAFVRFHEYSGLQEVRAMSGIADDAERTAQAERAFGHLQQADAWGLMANERVVRGLMTTSWQLDRLGDAERYARRFLTRRPGDVDTHLSLAQILIERKDEPGAERILRSLTAESDAADESLHASLAGAHQGLGGLLAGRGDFAGASEQLRMAVELAPERAGLHAELGGMLAEQGRLEEAVASLAEATRLDPDLAGAHYNLGTLLGHLGRFDEAVPHYRRAIDAGLDDADLHNNLGFAYLQLGDLPAAQAAFERAVAVDPNNANAHFNLARVLTAEQRFDAASDHLRTAATLDPRYAKLLENAQGGPSEPHP